MSLNSAQRSRLRSFKDSRVLRGVDVIYSTDSDDLSIRVVPASTNTMRTDSETNIQIRDTVRDYLILPADLEVDDEMFWPKAGHLITESDESVYEIVRDVAGKPGVHWDDEQTKQIIRVHTQVVAGT